MIYIKFTSFWTLTSYLHQIYNLLKSIWHENSFLSIERTLFKNLKSRVLTKSDKKQQSYEHLKLWFFIQNLVFFSARPNASYDVILLGRDLLIAKMAAEVSSFHSQQS